MKTENAVNKLKRVANDGQVHVNANNQVWAHVGIYVVGFIDQQGKALCFRIKKAGCSEFYAYTYCDSLTQALALAKD